MRDEQSYADAVFCHGSEIKVRSSQSLRTLIMISIRGTYEAGDILQDFKFKQASFGQQLNVKVHKGDDIYTLQLYVNYKSKDSCSSTKGLNKTLCHI